MRRPKWSWALAAGLALSAALLLGLWSQEFKADDSANEYARSDSASSLPVPLPVGSEAPVNRAGESWTRSASQAIRYLCSNYDSERSAARKYVLANPDETIVAAEREFDPNRSEGHHMRRIACYSEILCSIDAKDSLVRWYEDLLSSQAPRAMAGAVRGDILGCFPGADERLLPLVGEQLKQSDEREAGEIIGWLLRYYRRDERAIRYVEEYSKTSPGSQESVRNALEILRGSREPWVPGQQAEP